MARPLGAHRGDGCRDDAAKFSNNVYIAPGRDLFTVAKLVSSAAVISGGRVSLGTAAGWCQEEFELAGQDFHNRGKRLNEMIVALRSLWAGGWQEFHGSYYDFEPLQIATGPPSPIPIYLGGDSEPALKRAAALGDGWIGNAYSIEDADAVLDRLHGHLKAHGRSIDGFETVMALYVEPTPDVLRRFEDRGVTALMCAPWMSRRPPGATSPRRSARRSTPWKRSPKRCSARSEPACSPNALGAHVSQRATSSALRASHAA